jgi:hypothetical protein
MHPGIFTTRTSIFPHYLYLFLPYSLYFTLTGQQHGATISSHSKLNNTAHLGMIARLRICGSMLLSSIGTEKIDLILLARGESKPKLQSIVSTEGGSLLHHG